MNYKSNMQINGVYILYIRKVLSNFQSILTLLKRTRLPGRTVCTSQHSVKHDRLLIGIASPGVLIRTGSIFLRRRKNGSKSVF